MKSPILDRILETLMNVIVPMALMYCWGLPVWLGMRFGDPIDLLPYFECIGGGLVLGVVVSRGLAWLARKRVAGLTSSRLGNWGVAFIVFMPTWAVFLGLGANRWLDHSPAAEHPTETLAWELAIKSRAHCRVTSWRGRASEEVTEDIIFAAEAASPERAVPGRRADKSAWVYPRACVPGTPLIVASHPGALGWDWIEYVRVPGAPPGQSEGR